MHRQGGQDQRHGLQRHREERRVRDEDDCWEVRWPGLLPKVVRPLPEGAPAAGEGRRVADGPEACAHRGLFRRGVRWGPLLGLGAGGGGRGRGRPPRRGCGAGSRASHDGLRERSRRAMRRRPAVERCGRQLVPGVRQLYSVNGHGEDVQRVQRRSGSSALQEDVQFLPGEGWSLCRQRVHRGLDGQVQSLLFLLRLLQDVHRPGHQGSFRPRVPSHLRRVRQRERGARCRRHRLPLQLDDSQLCGRRPLLRVQGQGHRQHPF